MNSIAPSGVKLVICESCGTARALQTRTSAALEHRPKPCKECGSKQLIIRNTLAIRDKCSKCSTGLIIEIQDMKAWRLYTRCKWCKEGIARYSRYRCCVCGIIKAVKKTSAVCDECIVIEEAKAAAKAASAAQEPPTTPGASPEK